MSGPFKELMKKYQDQKIMPSFSNQKYHLNLQQDFLHAQNIISCNTHLFLSGGILTCRLKPV